MAYLPEQRLEPPRPPEPDCICSACLGELYGDEEVTALTDAYYAATALEKKLKNCLYASLPKL